MLLRFLPHPSIQFSLLLYRILPHMLLRFPYQLRRILSQVCMSLPQQKNTKADVDELDFFVETHTSKKKKGFVDERSKEAAEKMVELVREHTDESGVCSLPRHEAVERVMGPGTKGRERGQGRVAKPPSSKITVADLERAREEMREEIAELRQDCQSQVAQAVAEALRLFREGIQQIPPTQGTGSQQPPSAEEDNLSSRASRQ